MDIVRLVQEFIILIKANEYEKAVRLVDKAEKSARTTNVNVRRESIHQINLSLLKTKIQREDLYAVIDDYPTQDRLFLRAQVDKICQSFLDPYIAELRNKKRRLSRC